MTPAEKLARSRLAIIEQLQRRDHRRDKRQDRDEAQAADDASGSGARRRSSRGSGWFGGIGGAARSWWERHPAQMALDMATPMLQDYIRRRPFQVLTIAAGAGALIYVTKPWRLISLTTLLVAVVKSSQLSGVVMSALADAQGWHRQQEGQEPQL